VAAYLQFPLCWLYLFCVSETGKKLEAYLYFILAQLKENLKKEPSL